MSCDVVRICAFLADQAYGAQNLVSFDQPLSLPMPSSSEQAEPPEPSVREATDGFEATNPGHAPKLLETRPSSNMISNAREGANRQRSRESPRNANGETSVISRADKDASASLGSRALQVSGHPHINSMR